MRGGSERLTELIPVRGTCSAKHFAPDYSDHGIIRRRRGGKIENAEPPFSRSRPATRRGTHLPLAADEQHIGPFCGESLDRE